jgi:hypothetical protein
MYLLHIDGIYCFGYETLKAAEYAKTQLSAFQDVRIYRVKQWHFGFFKKGDDWYLEEESQWREVSSQV